KGAASKQLVNGPQRETRVKYRRPHGTDWEELDLETATDMIADRVIAARAATWEDRVDDDPNRKLHRTRRIAFLGGATLDSEENYLIKRASSGATRAAPPSAKVAAGPTSRVAGLPP